MVGDNNYSSIENIPCIDCAGGVFMCRRNQVLAYVMLGFGTGLMIGHCLESWIICTCGSVVFLILGFGGVCRK
jgi:hypothetical protein